MYPLDFFDIIRKIDFSEGCIVIYKIIEGGYSMKLVIAIVHDEDAGGLIEELTNNKYRITKLATTGGFLRAGNTTLLVGTEDEEVEKVIGIIKNNCESRRELVTSPAPVSGTTGVFIPYPIEVTVGGATVFVVDVEKYVKL